PLRLQPVVARPQGWRGQSAGLIAVGLTAFVLVAVVLGTTFDDGRPASSAPIAAASLPTSSATTRPSRRPTPTPEPLATPLPSREVLGGQIPTERRLVNAIGLELLDLATGELTPLGQRFDYPSISLPLANGGTVCACVVRDETANGGTGSWILRFGTYDPSGAAIVERDVQSFDDVVPVNDRTEGFNVTAALDPDSRSMFILVAERRPPVWTISLEVVDVESGDVTSREEIERIPVGFEEPEPSASPPANRPRDGIYVWATWVTPAPGGRTAMVSIDRSEVRNDNWAASKTLEWMVGFGPGKSARVTPLEPAAALEPGDWCMSQPTFLDATQLVQVCLRSGTSLEVRRVGSDGASLGPVPVISGPFDGSFPMSVVIDRTRRAFFIWDLQHHVVVKVDLDDGRVTTWEVPEFMLPDGGREAGGYGYVGGDPGAVLSPDGRRLYAIGIAGGQRGGPGVPSGIWVFDAVTLELIGHWQPRAYLSSLAVSRDGRFVYAAAAAGFDVNGRENAWPASVTVYDAADGEIEVIYGAVARDTWLSFVALP
ncbi:MAG TPA: hypothetical protein VFW02_11505, partial [Candidatus Limnocylindrales bacterium]|nr:hypothetical protein [Candidatus Limnocylindrales bacterium]